MKLTLVIVTPEGEKARAACSRVTGSSGVNVVAEVPVVTPRSTAHVTASRYQSAVRSVKPELPETAGEPASL